MKHCYLTLLLISIHLAVTATLLPKAVFKAAITAIVTEALMKLCQLTTLTDHGEWCSIARI